MAAISTRIIEMKAQNVGRLKYVVVRPSDRRITEIVGENGMGKSTVLNLVDMILDTKISQMPLKKGEKKGELFITTEVEIDGKTLEVHFARRYSEANQNGTLIIEPKKVGDFTTPAQIAREIFGKVPLVAISEGFARMKTEEQIELLTKAVSEDANKDVIEDIIRSAGVDNYLLNGDSTYQLISNAQDIIVEHRKGIKREITSLKTVIDTLPASKVEEVSIAALQEEEAEVEQYQKSREKLSADLLRFVEEKERIVSAKAEKTASIEKLRKEIAELESGIAADDARIVKADEAIAAQEAKIAAPDDTERRPLADIKAAIASASETNTKAAKYKERVEKETRLKEIEESHKACEAAIANLKAYRQTAIDLSKLNVPGLEIIDETDENGKRTKYGVFVDGVPVAQLGATDAAILDVTVKHAINPQVKLLRIDEWGTYDEKRRKAILDFAEANDLHILVARVATDNEKVGIELLDEEYIDHYEEAA